MKTGTQLAAVHTSIDFRAERSHIWLTRLDRFALIAFEAPVATNNFAVRIESGNTTGLVT